MADVTSSAAHWNLTCQTVQSHASSMAAGCRREAAALIHGEAKAFCEREAPDTEAESNRRHQQAMHVISKIGIISHADLMARSHPNVSDQIMASVKSFLESVGIDESPHKEIMTLISTISTICSSDVMQCL